MNRKVVALVAAHESPHGAETVTALHGLGDGWWSSTTDRATGRARGLVAGATVLGHPAGAGKEGDRGIAGTHPPADVWLLRTPTADRRVRAGSVGRPQGGGVRSRDRRVPKLGGGGFGIVNGRRPG